ncbi:DUF5997 family protein, partial [Streptomyces sp. NPDC057654]|uniref:DUF5997 family protein n=1 Tax=Streptomyces sp. NPDC057654 TaxID=3346196 RepID=UPI00369EC77D
RAVGFDLDRCYSAYAHAFRLPDGTPMEHTGSMSARRRPCLQHMNDDALLSSDQFARALRISGRTAIRWAGADRPHTVAEIKELLAAPPPWLVAERERMGAQEEKIRLRKGRKSRALREEQAVFVATPEGKVALTRARELEERAEQHCGTLNALGAP